MYLWAPLSLVALVAQSGAVLIPQTPSDHTKQAVLNESPSSIPVPVVLGVMSRCPDAILCETVFNRAVDLVGHAKIELGLTFIGTLNATEPTYGVTCMHGPSECLGNIHQLCTIAHTPSAPLPPSSISSFTTPSSSSQFWWPFVQCLDLAGREKIGDDETTRACARAVGIDWEGTGIAACVAGGEGIELLKKSVAQTQQLGIDKSCTILINGGHRCMHDTTWKECEEGHKPADFVRVIEEEYEKLNSRPSD